MSEVSIILIQIHKKEENITINKLCLFEIRKTLKI